MRRTLKWAAWSAGILLLLPVLAVAAVLIALNIPAGQHEAESMLASVLGPDIVVRGISGTIPSAPRVAHVELRDAKGVWLAIDDIALDWTPSALLSRVAHVNSLSAGHVSMPRLPEPSGPAKPSSPSSGSSSLPVKIQVDAAHIARADLGAPVAGQSVSLTADATARLESLQEGQATATVKRLDGDGRYALSGRIDQRTLAAKVDLDEPAHGFLGSLASLPELGALSAHATVDGPWTGAKTALTVAAGPLRAAVNGTVDINGQSADLDVTANAPAMAPRADVHWQSVALNAHVHGPFTEPDASGTLKIADLAAAGAALRSLDADVKGNAGVVELRATVDGLTIPGPKPDLLQSAPLVLTADARLDRPDRPVTFTLAHPVIAANGQVRTGGDLGGTVDLTLPDLAPLAAMGGVDLHGQSRLTVKAATANGVMHADVDGTLGVTSGMAPVPGLVGPEAKIGVTATIQGSDVSVSRLRVDGRTAKIEATGGIKDGTVGLDWKVALADLAVLAPTISGKLDATGHVAGKTNDLTATADASGEIATKGFPRGPVKVALNAKGLPGAPSGHVEAQAVLEGSPLTLSATADRAADGTLNVTIEKGGWKTASASGALTLAPGEKLPTGKVSLKVERLADFSALAGQALGGSLEADADLGRDEARLKLQARNAGLPGSGVAAANLDARVRDPLGHPTVRATLAIDGLKAGAAAGNVKLDLDGPEEALGFKLAVALGDLMGAPLDATTAGTLDVPKMDLAIASLNAGWKGETLRLLAPTRVSLKDGISVARTQIGLQNATLDVAGKISPQLDLTASLRNVTPDLARAFMPDLLADGTITADARLTGTPVKPDGTVKLVATGLRMRTGPAAGLPAAGINADVALAGTSARVDTRIVAGRNEITITGTAPLDPAGQLALRAAGRIDLAVTDPILMAQARRARGIVTLDATVTGTIAAPRASGSLRLAGGEVQDFSQGVHIRDIEASIEANGDTVRIARFAGKAGQGTISAAGTVGLAAPMPVAITVTARNASPLDGDKLNVSLNADITARGDVQGALDVDGSVKINSAQIRVPENMPTQVATLNVIRPGQKPPPPPAANQTPSSVRLNLAISAPGQIFVRGRGLDAELQGNIRVRGTTGAPNITGGFQLRRGTFSLAGASLTFSKGTVTFDGSGKIDPLIDFVATTSTTAIVANLEVSGYASAPKISLSSTPTVPQDEVLAQVLFHQSASSLSPFQLAQIAAALAQLSGATGGGMGPLDKLRAGLGLDQLSVGGGSSGSSATVQAGRYVAPGVYVGAKQGVAGAGGTQATVQVDITKGLKLETTVGTGGSATGAASTGQSQGTGVGLTYQFQY